MEQFNASSVTRKSVRPPRLLHRPFQRRRSHQKADLAVALIPSDMRSKGPGFTIALSNRWKQLPAPLDQPADHSGVEDVRELLRCTRPGLPHPPRFFCVLTQSQMCTPIQHQPCRQPLQKKVGIEAKHQTSFAGGSSEVLQKTNHQIARDPSLKDMIQPGISPPSHREATDRLHQQMHRDAHNRTTGECLSRFLLSA